MEEIEAKALLMSCSGENWFGHSWNLNLYRGCCHGCIYCDSRSACYHVHQFDQVRTKKDVLSLLEKELRGKTRKGVVGMGAMSDPYNPFERERLLTRGAEELLLRNGFGVSIATKSDLIVRDAELLGEIARFHPALAKITITADSDALCRKIERNVCPSSARYATLARLRGKGVFAGILLMPVLPFIEDTEENLLAIVRHAKDCGARFIYPMLGVTLRGNQRQWFYERLEEDFPGVRQKYERTYGDAYECISPRADALYELLVQACREAGILYEMPKIIAASRAPYEPEQLRLI